MLSTTGTFCDLLNGLANDLSSTLNPDDPSVLQALAFAACAATAAADGPAVEDWKSYGFVIQHAAQTLHADLVSNGARTHEGREAGPDSLELRRATTELVERLADLYATAAADAIDSRYQRVIWSRVALYLEDAAAELA
ncbi:hypothetical protein AB0M46_28585 [Dactylosporangium sp. NPDC051485]|uniref:hypothetical protein n=1 Tax=Dactylosporangium sp. NPDC051485 TaxID=3154846 RepID=UPI0034452611